MSSFHWDLVVWGLLGLYLLVAELAAVFGWAPWNTLSDFSWRLEDLSSWVKILFLAGQVVLTVHIVARWPR